MNSGFLPIYNKVISRKKLLCERIEKDGSEEIWQNHYILEFNPNTKHSSEFLASSVSSGFPTDLIHLGKEYCSFKLKITDNIGDNDGKEFLEWIQSFYDEKNNYYRFNIYDNNARNISLYIINKNMKKIARFYMSSCVIKNPLFFSYNRSNSESPQIAITLCTKQSVSINHLNNIIN